ncbi:MAG: DUF3466 family protein [Thiobacillus sp.]
MRYSLGNIHLAVLLLCLVIFPTSVHAGVIYQITDLGTLGGSESYAKGLNDAGQVVGYSYLTDNRTVRAFQWSNGVLAQSIPFTPSIATAINNAGQVVGNAYTASGRNAAIINGTEIAYSSKALAISNNGVAVGSYDPGGRATHAALWRVSNLNPFNTAPLDLGSLQQSSVQYASQATGVNGNGVVVGWSEILASAYQVTTHAVVWENGQIRDLGVLADSSWGVGFSKAMAINDHGQIVGISTAPGNINAAMLWQNGQMLDLGNLSGADWTQANDINNLGQVVGISGNSAFLWSGGAMLNLNDLVPNLEGWTLTEAVGINDGGQIVVNGIDQIGSMRHAFLLNPVTVPEPGTLALVMLGIATYFGRQRTNQK